MTYPKPRPQHKDLAVRRGLSGLGIFATKDIPRNTFLIEYWGEIVTEDEANRRGGKYLFELENGKTIVGTTRKNTARYVNHSCKPNSEALEEMGRVFITSKRGIKAGEEISYNYGRAYCKEHIIPYGCKCGYCDGKGNRSVSKKQG